MRCETWGVAQSSGVELVLGARPREDRLAVGDLQVLAQRLRQRVDVRVDALVAAHQLLHRRAVAVRALRPGVHPDARRRELLADAVDEVPDLGHARRVHSVPAAARWLAGCARAAGGAGGARAARGRR